MGHTLYSSTLRDGRVGPQGPKGPTGSYYTAPVNTIFTQNKLKSIHESMDPKSLVLRESRDSETHPNTVPIILTLDVTGSMGHIPEHLVRNGLPKMMDGMIQRGVKDAALLFMAVGDHECDRCPLQVGQFESGDEELDMWLTRTYLEGGGGPNDGESYLLAWYLAAHHTDIDSFNKRGQKGILFTIGDEPGLGSVSENALIEVFGPGQYKTYSDHELLNMASEKWDIYHILITGRGRSRDAEVYWSQLLGKKCLMVDDHNKIPELVANTVIEATKNGSKILTDNVEKYAPTEEIL